MPSRPWPAVDVLTAVALAALAQLETWTPQLVPGVGEVLGDRPVLAVTSLAATLPLAARRRWPLGVLLAVEAALVLQQVLTVPTEGIVLLLAAMVASYSSSAHSSTGPAGAAGLSVVVAAAFIGSNAGDWAFLAVVLGGAWLVGFVVMQRSTELHRVKQDNQTLQARLAEAAEQLAATARTPTAAADDLVGLTAREVDVARAIARGLTNAEIATDLVISEWTVKTHVASILRKLQLRDRAQVVIAVYESGLVTPGQAAGGTDTVAGRAARPR